MILTTPINGTRTKFPFINKTLWEFTRGVLYVHKCSKVIVRVIENRFCKEREYQLGCLLRTVQKG